jgi:hypothetical protein
VTMALDEAIDILKLLVPIAKTVPILGAPVEGSLEALSRILEFAQVRHLPAEPSSTDLGDRESRLRERKRRSLPSKPLAGSTLYSMCSKTSSSKWITPRSRAYGLTCRKFTSAPLMEQPNA